MAPRYITSDELASLIKSADKVAKKDYLVVDVRDDDYAGGNIKDALNIPSRAFLMNVDKLVKDAKGVKLVVFHCALSQVRGPKAARIFEETALHARSGDEPIPEVAILREGFSSFQTQHKDDPDLVENWDKDVWASDWS